MAEVLRVTITHFDSLENDADRARSTEDLGTFGNDDNGTVNEKVRKLLADLDEPRYLGWDGEVYPIVRVEKVEMR
ncbi:MAG TPA: hypothetical protein VMZ50_08295 [Phycisphaerae bacterium]|nr:hypothetical protein [Phycisphaerae bacterium]